MLKKLRSLSPDAKRKVAFLITSLCTFAVFIFWIFNFSGALIGTMNDTVKKGANVYSVFEQNIEKVYNQMQDIIPKDFGGVVNNNTNIGTTTSTSTEIIMYDNNISTSTQIK